MLARRATAAVFPAKPQTTYVYIQATKSSGSRSNYEEKGATNSALKGRGDGRVHKTSDLKTGGVSTINCSYF